MMRTAPRTIPAAALAPAVAILFAACEDVYDDAPPYVETYSVYIDPLPETTTSGLINITGSATCDACPESQAWLGWCQEILGPFPSGIDIQWNNVDTGATGGANHMITGRCACLFSTCWTVYEHEFFAQIPLAIGSNTLQVAAIGPAKSPGHDQAVVVRLPRAPESIVARAAAANIEVEWTPVAGADSYDLYWAAGPIGDLAAAVRVEGATSPWTHTRLGDEATIHYKVVAVDEGWRSAPSAGAWATTGWSSEALPSLSEAIRGEAIGLAFDSAYRAHVHTCRSTGTDDFPDYINEYLRIGAAGETPLQLQVPGVQHADAGIALDRSGVPHLGWSGSFGLVHGTPNGTSWITETIDQPSTCRVEFTLDTLGRPHFASTVQVATTPVVDELRHVSNETGAWTRSVVSSGNYDCASSRQLALAVEQDGTPHLAWLGGWPDYGVRHASRHGGVWTVETIASGPKYGLALALDAAGLPCVAWCDSGSVLVLARPAIRGGWTNEVVDTGVYWPSISLLVDDAGATHFAYWGTPPGLDRPVGLYHASNGDGLWRRVPVHPSSPSRTVLAAGPDGRVHAAWLSGPTPMLSRRL